MKVKKEVNWLFSKECQSLEDRKRNKEYRFRSEIEGKCIHSKERKEEQEECPKKTKTKNQSIYNKKKRRRNRWSKK